MAEKRKANKERLKFWQERLAVNEAAYSKNIGKMDKRERLYLGDPAIKPMTDKDKTKDGKYRTASHVRNIVAENIEAQVSSAIPQPKVTARYKKDEAKAVLIENMLRNELNRLPFEEINDMMERTVPIQGGAGYLVEWDNTQRTHNAVGEVVVSAIHPKEIVPQDGVYSGIPDMDFIILKIPQTKEYIKRRYGVDVDDESESDPEVKSSGDASPANDMVTQHIAYYRNDSGGIGLYSWVNDTELEDLEDYQARRLRRCADCGALEPVAGTEFMRDSSVPAGQLAQVGADSLAVRALAESLAARQLGLEERPPAGVPLEADAEVQEEPKSFTWNKGDPCPYCGGKEFREGVEEYEEIYTEIRTSNGAVIPGARPAIDDSGRPYMKPTKIPFYKPDVYPIVLQKNVSVYGQFLGDSDVDKIASQQNTINRLETKIMDRIIKAGTRITLPNKAHLRTDPEDGERWFLDGPEEKNMIDVYDFTGNLQYEMLHLANVYEEARQIIGVTDSFQGRRDTTANSGKAKEFAAAQTAGRLESKRVMKEAAYAELFKLIFQFKLAYADEPRPVVYTDRKGNTQYGEFDRYDFLEQDSAGEYYWNDQFLFACDSSAPLANNRERLWQETTSFFTAGCFGPPERTETQISFWTKMELLHYPGAGDTRRELEERLARERQQAQAIAEMQARQAQVNAQQQRLQETMKNRSPQETAVRPAGI